MRGSMWTMGGFGFSRALRLINHLILAWLLMPEIFGLMALVKVFMHGLQMFSDIGIGPSIIQNRRGHDSNFLNTAWTIQIIRGFSLWIICCVLAVPFAWWYSQNDPAAWQLSYLLPVAAFTTVIAGFNSTALFTLNKDLRLGKVTLIELGTQVVSLTVMIVWALIHPSVWAMIAGAFAATIFKVVLSHFMVPGHSAKLQWDRECGRELLNFGKWIFLSTAFTFLALNLDKLVLGKILTLSELGIYSIALVFAKAALDVASRLGGTVMFPVYSKLQNQPNRLMAVALRARDAVLWVGAAVCICFAVGAPLFFETLWDPRYHAAGIIAQWSAIYIWARILLYTMGRIPLALGNSRSLFFATIIQTCGIFTALAGYYVYGLPGFLVGLAVGPVATHLFLVLYLPLRRKEMVWQTVRFTAMAGCAGTAAVGYTSWLRTVTSPTLWMIAVIVCAAIPLAVGAIMGYRRTWGEDHRKIIPKALHKKAETP